ncbi:alpha-glucoside ABC transporter permease [Vibrio sp. vnigr-6D03]|uniref:carbohydrate ABC transporter permease n=1 Tax=Vibrio sp. vnigr-6D03 TaxID=2058088 RepID=UPI000C343308|nr:carbohydrate ABC transporter permease [Vibrio sp. vnigr-6D03]PKF80311.1 alpha-glucoside ABC transporter permease [Vibrio sp. vnigr-6D03]
MERNKKKLSAGTLFKHGLILFFVLAWTLPTLGLLVSSVRDKDQLAISGWWTAMVTTERNEVVRTGKKGSAIRDGDQYVIAGNLFEENSGRTVDSWGERAKEIDKHQPGEAVELKNGSVLTVMENGEYRWESNAPFTHKRGKRIFHVANIPPRFTFENYIEVLASEGVGQAFVNSLTVTIPATFIPIMIAAFAAYGLAWMDFRGKSIMLAIIVGLLVVPLQMSLIPVLRLYNEVGSFFDVATKSYPGVWLAHTGFGLPLAIYLLRNYMAGLPKEIMESSRMDGANHFQTFIKVVLPLSLPALASFAIFQFLWVWNDLLVAMVYLGNSGDKIVLTAQLRELLGSRGDNWEILTSGAFITIIVPLVVFLSLQRYFVRGLLSGSVKGG